MKRYPKYKDSGVEWVGEIPEGWETKKLKYKVNTLIMVPMEINEVPGTKD